VRCTASSSHTDHVQLEAFDPPSFAAELAAEVPGAATLAELEARDAFLTAALEQSDAMIARAMCMRLEHALAASGAVPVTSYTRFCRPPGSGRTYLHEVPMEVAEDPRSLGLSARSFQRPGVRRIDIVDRKHGRRLNGRKPLWLYIRTDAERPLQPKICRFLDAVLDRQVRTLLAERRASEGLADDLLVQQRSALGLDDGTCGKVMTWPSPPGGLDRGGLLVESPIAKAVEVERWIAH